LNAKPKMSVFERADQAGAYRALRLEALKSDPGLLAIMRTQAVVEASARLLWLQRQTDAETEAIVFDRDDADDRAVERMSTAAAADDAYRVQLLDLAALHGGLYLRAVDALYAVEVQSLGRWEAEARHQLDLRQLTETRRRDAEAD
jgi:hypothetical protein